MGTHAPSMRLGQCEVYSPPRALSGLYCCRCRAGDISTRAAAMSSGNEYENAGVAQALESAALQVVVVLISEGWHRFTLHGICNSRKTFNGAQNSCESLKSLKTLELKKFFLKALKGLKFSQILENP